MVTGGCKMMIEPYVPNLERGQYSFSFSGLVSNKIAYLVF